MKENTLAQFGIIGLGVMGSNIALNVGKQRILCICI